MATLRPTAPSPEGPVSEWRHPLRKTAARALGEVLEVARESDVDPDELLEIQNRAAELMEVVHRTADWHEGLRRMTSHGLDGHS